MQATCATTNNYRSLEFHKTARIRLSGHLNLWLELVKSTRSCENNDKLWNMVTTTTTKSAAGAGWFLQTVTQATQKKQAHGRNFWVTRERCLKFDCQTNCENWQKRLKNELHNLVSITKENLQSTPVRSFASNQPPSLDCRHKLCRDVFDQKPTSALQIQSVKNSWIVATCERAIEDLWIQI